MSFKGESCVTFFISQTILKSEIIFCFWCKHSITLTVIYILSFFLLKNGTSIKSNRFWFKIFKQITRYHWVMPLTFQNIYHSIYNVIWYPAVEIFVFLMIKSWAYSPWTIQLSIYCISFCTFFTGNRLSDKLQHSPIKVEY